MFLYNNTSIENSISEETNAISEIIISEKCNLKDIDTYLNFIEKKYDNLYSEFCKLEEKVECLEDVIKELKNDQDNLEEQLEKYIDKNSELNEIINSFENKFQDRLNRILGV